MIFIFFQETISDHQQSWWYEEGPSKGPVALLVVADLCQEF